jgi:hypothetical protein
MKIIYEQVPVTTLDAELIKRWLVRDEANLFRRCITSQMHQHYVDAINIQAQAKTKEDQEKFNKQSQIHLDQARDLQNFIRVFEQLANPNTGYYTIKINT